MTQLVNKFLILALMFSLGCASVSLEPDKQSARVFGKATASTSCVEATEDTPKSCETKAEGEGLTENAVQVITSFFEALVKLPGFVVRGAGGVLP